MNRISRVVLAIVTLIIVLALRNVIEAQRIPETMYQELRWRMIGPFRGGRTRAATGVASQPNVFFIGQVNGGVWKSDDYGRTWLPIFDSQPTQSIGDIAVAPSDPHIIYVSSGEGLHRPDLSVGNGIYRSADGGKTWTHLGLEDGQQIPSLAIDPGNPNRVFAAVLGHPYGPNQERGIYRSTDGGKNWQRVLFKDENTGGSYVEIDPSNPALIYACLWEVREGPWEDENMFSGTGGGLFKSTDGGTTWRALTNGLPKNLVQIYVTISASDPKRLYATVSTTEKGDYASGRGLGVYRSDDAGETWYRVTTDPRPAMRIGGGDLPVPKVDPENPDVLYSASIVTMRSRDGGKSWTAIRGAPGGDDYQNLWINPRDARIILLASDQGAIVTVNGGESWSSWYNQPTAQLYHVGVSNTFPYRVCSGQQESGSICISSRGMDGEITFRDWHPVGAIEYGYVVPDPLDPDIVYGAGRTEVSKFHWSTGQVQNITPIPIRDHKYRVDRTEPILFSPLDLHTFYFAANVLFKTTDGGRNWQTISPDLSREATTPPSVGDMAKLNPDALKQRGVIYALGTSFKTVDTLWAGTDDGLIWLTHDGGKNWKNITPAELTAWSKVTQIEASHFDDRSAYASVSRFRIDDLRPYIYRTHDGGVTWQLITNGLPNAPVDTVREDPVRQGLLFAGTETAVWVSFDDGDHWQSLQLNLPHTSMRDLWIHDDDLIVATHGRSFWILDDITPLRQLSESLSRTQAYLFSPRAAYRVRRDTNTDTPIPPDEPTGENPASGAIIDYYLAKPVSGAITLEILDAQGKSVRRYSSADKPEPSEAELRKQLIPLYWIRGPKTLPAGQGMQRWVWDLHYPTPLATRYEYPISAVAHDTPRLPLGPRALPAQYTVRLTVKGTSYTAPLVVKMDPRVKTPSTGLDQQFKLETRLASDLTLSSEAVLGARSVRTQLKNVSAKASGSLAEAIKQWQAKLKNILEGTEQAGETAPSPSILSGVNRKIGTIYADVDRADVEPTPAQAHAADEAERDLSTVLKQWEQLQSSDLPTWNRQLQLAGLTQIHSELMSQAPEGESDEN